MKKENNNKPFLLLLRGVPGSGKSTFVNLAHLKELTIETDEIRLEIAGLNKSGTISQAKNDLVWQTVQKDLEKRMKEQEHVVVDATHVYKEDIAWYLPLVEKHGYRIILGEIGKTIPLKELLDRNNRRADFRKVPEDVIKKLHFERLKPFQCLSGYQIEEIHFHNVAITKYVMESLAARGTSLDFFELKPQE